MRRSRWWILSLIAVSSLAVALPAQEFAPREDGARPAGNPAGETVVTTEHYVIQPATDGDAARDLGRRLEAFLALYNYQFRFPLEELDERLNVRLFDSRPQFDAYLEPRIGEAPGPFVYLHYPAARDRELVGYVGAPFSDEALIHHSFVQFLRAFVSHPPLWIREGFAVYFAETSYDDGFQRAVYRENVAWLATLKEMLSGDSSRRWIPWHDLLSMSAADVQENAESFYPQAWGLVSFLLNDESPETNRLAWDSIRALDRTSTLAENNQAVYEQAFRWESEADLEDRFQEYVASRRTFTEWVTTGVERYNRGDISGAERAMMEALHMRRDHHVPFYYLGLIGYDRQDFATAAHYYQQALERADSSAAVIRYAQAVNAVADDRPGEARSLLEAIPADDSSVSRRAEELLRRLPSTGGR